MKAKPKNRKEKVKGNKAMFYVGTMCVLASAILLLWNLMGESTFPTILGILGVIFIAASNFRLLK
jgi:uncharacterized membrane protein HdeD (DUF308 family)